MIDNVISKNNKNFSSNPLVSILQNTNLDITVIDIKNYSQTSSLSLSDSRALVASNIKSNTRNLFFL